MSKLSVRQMTRHWLTHDEYPVLSFLRDRVEEDPRLDKRQVKAVLNILMRADLQLATSDDVPEDQQVIHGVAMGLSMAVDQLAYAYRDHPAYDKDWTP